MEENKEITLIVMAAGIGSRYGGGIKQLEEVGPHGETIIDYSAQEAHNAGFTKTVLVIRRDLEAHFRQTVGGRIAQYMDVDYAFQEITDIPERYQALAAARQKPWGTGQAVLCCRDKVSGPFLIINADDYYGRDAFKSAYAHLTGAAQSCMVGFILKNTLSDNGTVTRGVCQVDSRDNLVAIDETKNIAKTAAGITAPLAAGQAKQLDPDCVVSMNMWGFTGDFFTVLAAGFDEFLAGLTAGDNEREFLIPIFVGELLAQKKLAIKVLYSQDKWFGVTYKEDKDYVVAELEKIYHLQ